VPEPLNIGLLLFPRLTQLDLTGPYEVFSRLPGARVRLLWKTLEPVRADTGHRDAAGHHAGGVPAARPRLRARRARAWRR
jgi:putative intracellular protease/amidase